MLDIQSTKLGVIVALVTDVVLFLIMLSGLLRLGVHGSGTFVLGRFLWKQVWWCRFSLTAPLSIHQCIGPRKGVIWFLLATVAEVPSTVSLSLRLRLFFSFMSTSYLGVHMSEPERLFFPHPAMRDAD